jgi:ABC-type phosphate transport system substrate-binding protein
MGTFLSVPRLGGALLVLASLPATLLGEETVVVNPSVTAARLNDAALKDIYLGKTSIWDDGTKIVVVVLKEGPSNDALMRRLNKSPQQFLSSWKKLVFTGKGAMPEVVASDQALIDYVAKTPGAIAFVEKGLVKDGVKLMPIE